MGQTNDFFKEKKPWSVLKDEILDYYLTPYISKIQLARRPLYIFDCFAGKGKFDDGSSGSPLIIAEHIKRNLQQNPALRGKLQGAFIEKKYGADLENNLSGYPNTKVLRGTFEDNLKEILTLDNNSSIFLYIDPYGIKSLSLDNLNLIKEKRFSSVEMLMNFNSAGFLREACRLLRYTEPLGDDELTEYESDEDINTIDRMNVIAGGTYWQEILKKFYNREFNFHEVEDAFISEYSRTLRNIFKHIVNIPIKVRSNHLPKYRLVFGSNYEGGLILMADNMNKKWKELVDQQRNGQLALLDLEFPNLGLSQGFDLKKDIMSFVSAHSSGIPLRSLIVTLIQKYGITFSESHYKKTIGQMEKDSDLVIDRDPPRTRKTGKTATSMDYNDYKIVIRKH